MRNNIQCVENLANWCVCAVTSESRGHLLPSDGKKYMERGYYCATHRLGGKSCRSGNVNRGAVGASVL